MEFRILGPLEVHAGIGRSRSRREAPRSARGARAARERGGQRRAHGGRAVGRGRAAPERSRPSRFTFAVAPGARRPGALLSTTPAGYRLRVELGELDAERFERWSRTGGARSADALRRARGGRCCATRWRLWRGPPLADFAFAPFAQAAIALLEERRLAALELRVEADLARPARASWSASCRSWSPRIAERAAARPADARAYRCGARPTRSRPTARRAARWSTRSASSPDPSCGACTRRFCGTTQRSSWCRDRGSCRRSSRSPR